MLTPDLVLSEHSLPNFNVVEALKWLQDEKKDVPLILVTGSHSEEAVVECMKLGAEDYILKQSLIRLPPAVCNAMAKKQAERDRATTEAQYRLITESTRDLIGLLDRQFDVLYASPSYKRILAMIRATWIGRILAWSTPMMRPLRESPGQRPLLPGGTQCRTAIPPCQRQWQTSSPPST